MSKKVITIVVILILIIFFVIGMSLLYSTSFLKPVTRIFDKNNKLIDEIKYGDIEYFDNIKSYYIASSLDNILKDMESKENISEEEAEKILVTGGYDIYLCMDYSMQSRLEKVYDELEKDKENVESASVILDNKTGEIVAVVGGRNLNNDVVTFGNFNEEHKYTNKNLALEEYIIPGYFLTDISVYAYALENSYITLDSVIKEETAIGSYKPKSAVFNKNFTVKEAIINRYKIYPSNLMYNELNLEDVAKFLKDINIELNEYEKNVASITLGGMNRGVKLIDMAEAYRLIFIDGIYRNPTLYSLVKSNVDGNKYLESSKYEKNILSEYVVNSFKECLNKEIDGKYVFSQSEIVQGNIAHWQVLTDDNYTYTSVFYDKLKNSMNYEDNMAEKLINNVINFNK